MAGDADGVSEDIDDIEGDAAVLLDCEDRLTVGRRILRFAPVALNMVSPVKSMDFRDGVDKDDKDEERDGNGGG